MTHDVEASVVLKQKFNEMKASDPFVDRAQIGFSYPSRDRAPQRITNIAAGQSRDAYLLGFGDKTQLREALRPTGSLPEWPPSCSATKLRFAIAPPRVERAYQRAPVG
jgi:hypothetical protein